MANFTNLPSKLDPELNETIYLEDNLGKRYCDAIKVDIKTKSVPLSVY